MPRWRRLGVASVLVVAIGNAIGCDNRKPVLAEDPTTRNVPLATPTKPATTEPSLEEKLAALSPYAMPATTRSATTAEASTVPIRRIAEPATPEAAVQAVLAAIKEERWRDLRQMSLDQMSSEEVQERAAKIRRWLALGEITPVDSLNRGTLHVTILRARRRSGSPAYFPVLLIQRFDEWKCPLGSPNPRHLSPDEKAALNDVVDWTTRRIAELSGTSPATNAARATATRPAGDALPTPPNPLSP